MITDYEAYQAKVAARMQRERELLDGKLPCPLCGSHSITVVDWMDDSGEYDAIECQDCKCAAPADVWNRRAK